MELLNHCCWLDLATHYRYLYIANSISVACSCAEGLHFSAFHYTSLAFQFQLHVSTTLGMSWKLIGANISRFSWRSLDKTYEDMTAVYFESAVNGRQLVYFADQN